MEVGKLLSIITINYNRLKDTCELIDTLPLNDETIEVIVVDNASTQDEATEIGKRYPQVKVIKSDKNLGFAGGNNLGIKAPTSALIPQPSDKSLSVIRSDWYGLSENKVQLGLPSDTVRRIYASFKDNITQQVDWLWRTRQWTI